MNGRRRSGRAVGTGRGLGEGNMTTTRKSKENTRFGDEKKKRKVEEREKNGIMERRKNTKGKKG